MTIKLTYKKGSKETNAWMAPYGETDGRMWDIDAPGTLFHRSTKMLKGLKELGLIPGGHTHEIHYAACFDSRVFKRLP